MFVRALALVGVVCGVTVRRAEDGQQSIQPAASASPAPAAGPCVPAASIKFGITDEWCTSTCNEGSGAACNLAACVCGAEAEEELAKTDRAIASATGGGAAAPPQGATMAPYPDATQPKTQQAGECDTRFLPTCVPIATPQPPPQPKQQQQQPATVVPPEPATVPVPEADLDPRAEAGIRPEIVATTPAPVPTPFAIEREGLPTENVCDFEVVACINTTTAQLVPCIDWESRHPDAQKGEGVTQPFALALRVVWPSDGPSTGPNLSPTGTTGTTCAPRLADGSVR